MKIESISIREEAIPLHDLFIRFLTVGKKECVDAYIANFAITISTTDSITRRLARTRYKLTLIEHKQFRDSGVFRCPYPTHYTSCNQFRRYVKPPIIVDQNLDSINDSLTRRDVCSMCARYQVCLEDGIFESTSELKIGTNLPSGFLPDDWAHKVVFLKTPVSWGKIREGEEKPRDPFNDLNPKNSVSIRHLLAHTLSFDQNKPILPDTIHGHHLSDTVYCPNLGTQLSEFDIGLLLLISTVRPLSMPATTPAAELDMHPFLPLIQSVSKLSRSHSMDDVIEHMYSMTEPDMARIAPRNSSREFGWSLHLSGRDWCNSILTQLNDEEVSIMEKLLETLTSTLDQEWPMIVGDATLHREHCNSSTRPYNINIGNPIQGAAWRLLELFPESIRTMLGYMKHNGRLSQEDWKKQNHVMERIEEMLESRRNQHKQNLPSELDDIFGSKWNDTLAINPVKSVIAIPMSDDVKIPWHPLIEPIEIVKVPELESVLFYSNVLHRE